MFRARWQNFKLSMSCLARAARERIEKNKLYHFLVFLITFRGYQKLEPHSDCPSQCFTFEAIFDFVLSVLYCLSLVILYLVDVDLCQVLFRSEGNFIHRQINAD